MIRAATEADYPALEAHCAEFWKSAPFDEAYRAGSAVMYFDIAREAGLLLVAERDGVIVGFAAGAISPLMGDSGVLQGAELAWWVAPDHRGGTLGIRLLQALEDAGRAAGCRYWNMIFMETSMPEAVRSIYERLGYTLKETVYGRRLD